MKTKYALLILITSIAASNALATKYNFRQGGWGTGNTFAGDDWVNEGAVVSGYFVGDDSNGDGWVSSLDSEITELNWFYSGDSFLNPFSGGYVFGSGDETSIVFKLDDNILGNDIRSPFVEAGDRELLQSTNGPIFYVNDLIIGDYPGGFLEREQIVTGIPGETAKYYTAFSRERMYVWVPDSGSTAMLLLAGMVCLLATHRRFGRS